MVTQCTAGRQCWPGQAGLQVSPQSWEGCEGQGALWLDLPLLGTQGGGSHLSDTGGLQGAPQSSPSGFWSWFSGSQTNRESVSCVDAVWLLCQPLGTDGKGFETEPGEL